MWTLREGLSATNRLPVASTISLEAIRDGAHIALSVCGEIYRAQEVNRRMKDEAVLLATPFAAVAFSRKWRRRKGTATAEHLKFVLSVIDRPHFAKGKYGPHGFANMTTAEKKPFFSVAVAAIPRVARHVWSLADEARRHARRRARFQSTYRCSAQL